MIKKLLVIFPALLLVIGLVTLAEAYTLSPEEIEVIDLINAERHSEGIAPLLHNATLSAVAHSHSVDMATNNFFSHDSFDGTSAFTRINEAGYDGSPLGEVIGAGFSDAQSIVDAWMNSPGHQAILLDSSFDRIGVGYYYGPGSSYLYYWTADFGNGGSIDPVPVPSTLLLLSSGLLGLGLLGRRQRKQS
ncbi:MAG: CAP domain-containing protein [Syntrophobacterales bacterium]